MNDIEFIETLKQKRNACDYSQSRLAQELQISRQNLNEIENGKTKASMESGLLHFLPYQREHIVFRWYLRQRLRYVQLLDFCMRIRTASIWWNGCCLILRLNRCTKQKLRSIIIYEFSLFESKQKAQKGEIIHGFIGCRCTEWYRG